MKFSHNYQLIKLHLTISNLKLKAINFNGFESTDHSSLGSFYRLKVCFCLKFSVKSVKSISLALNVRRESIFLLFFRLITNSMPENQCLFSQLIYNSFGKILFPLNLMDREVLEKWFVIFYIIFENNLFSKVFHEIQNIEISLPIFIIDLDQFWHWSFCFWSDWRIHV